MEKQCDTGWVGIKRSDISFVPIIIIIIIIITIIIL
jgi:hypothetical protein